MIKVGLYAKLEQKTVMNSLITNTSLYLQYIFVVNTIGDVGNNNTNNSNTLLIYREELRV